MRWTVKNKTVNQLIHNCKLDLDRINKILKKVGATDPSVQYLNKYLTIKICWTLEQCFKTVIADAVIYKQSTQVKSYIDKTFRESSMNPSLHNIRNTLSKFDKNWLKIFSNSILWDHDRSRIESSIASLNDARNEFAHGWDPKVIFSNLRQYFFDSKKIINYLDRAVK